ncbi:MAG: radical SAM protein [Spirochaetaceae bacterium]
MTFSEAFAAGSGSYRVTKIYLQDAAAESVYTDRLLAALPEVPLFRIADKSEIPPEDLTMRTIYLHQAPQATFGTCPGSKGHRCCNYHTVDIYEGCPIGCSYCIMRSYLSFAPISINTALEQEIRAIREAARAHPNRPLRVGTGEVGDSLLYDSLTGISGDLIRGLAEVPNVHLELKTKTASVDHLLDIEEKGNAVIGFSVNPELLAAEQGSAAPMEARLTAALRASGAGYRLALHFDPIIAVEGWRDAYRDLVRFLEPLSPAVAWISLGTIRFTPALRDRMPDRGYLFDEFVPGRDGKYRYLQRRRRKIYSELLEALTERFDAPIYLCMESEAVWELVYGESPERIVRLRDIFDPLEDER